MKRVLWLLCGLFGLGCSAAEPGGSGAAGASAAAGSAGQGGASGAAGALSGGTASAGQASGGGANNAGMAGGASAGAVSNSGGGGSGGSAGSAAGASANGGGASVCTPEAAGALSVVGETVHDSKTCLDWMKTTKTGVNYAAAETFCADSALGGFDDWRIPSASEFASLVSLCGKYPPEGPIDTKVFDQQGDGYWTTTPAGEPNKVCAVGMLNAGGYYHFGTAGPQVVRCVRGTGTVKMVKDCVAAMGCSNWAQ